MSLENGFKGITQITTEMEAAIKRKSAQNLPNRPSTQGYSAEQIKNAFWKFCLDNENSIMAELKRFINETNEALLSKLPKISNSLMSQAVSTGKIGTSEIASGSIFICTDSGTYKVGHVYQFNNNEWIDTLAEKADKATTLSGYGITDAASSNELTNHTSNISNPHSVTKSQVGLGNVTNISQAAIDASNLSQGNVAGWQEKLRSSLVYVKSTNTGSMEDVSSLQELISLQFNNPDKSYVATIGDLFSNNLKTLLGNPSGFGNYTGVYTTKFYVSDNTIGTYTSAYLELIAFGIYTGKIAFGYVSKDSGGYYWSGWKIQ